MSPVTGVGDRPSEHSAFGAHGSVLVVNSGSSSVKYQLVNPVGGEAIASGLVERIGEPDGALRHTYGGNTTKVERPVADHGVALREILRFFTEVGPDLGEAQVVAVGHRVVHGGSVFAEPTLVDDDVVRQIHELSPMAPLHNPGNARGIEVARELLPDVPHVAVFDTAFFQTLPPAAATYALDREVAQRWGVRRYGFHGTSHQYVAGKVARVLGRPVDQLDQIVLHLGNGASASAVRRGVAVETSMGMTPLEGLVMGTRTGDIDPAVLLHLHRNAGMSVDEIDDLLNRRSGLKGLTGHNDLREVHRRIAEGDEQARLGLEVYVHRLRKYVGAYLAVLGRLDVLAFTAGVGENDAVVRAAVCAGLEGFGISVDPGRNEQRTGGTTVISPDGAPVTVMVVPTDEELSIARQVVTLVSGREPVPASPDGP